MSFRCPLCLQTLSFDDLIDVFCPQHGRLTAAVDVAAVWTGAAGACRVPGCGAVHQLEDRGLLVRHVGCLRGQSPFWNGDAAALVSRDDITSPHADGHALLTHWQVTAARHVAELGAPEMWFPRVLLAPAPNGRRPRRMVMMSVTGAKNVGKTFLAMHLLDDSGYGGTLRPLSDFIYTFPPAGSAAPEEFLRALRMRECLALDEPFGPWALPTPVRPRNLRAALFDARDLRPTTHVEGVSGAPLVPSAAPNALAELKAGWHAVRAALLGDQPPGPDVCALVVYDLAGECAEGMNHPLVSEHEPAMDVLAVMISAEDLVPGQPDAPTIRIANNRWRSIRASRKRLLAPRTCLIVSKLDLYRARTGDDLSTRTGGPRDALLEVLAAPGAGAAHRALALSLSANAGLVDEVFFVWPSEDPASCAAPTIQGLDRFVSWCFTG